MRSWEEDADDEGTVWFSESNAEEAILDQLSRLEESQLLQRGVRADEAEDDVGDHQGSPATVEILVPKFLDLGTGNGHLLFALREPDDEGRNWIGEMVGVDYSETSVQLARRIATQKQLSDIRFEHWDLLHDMPGDWLGAGFDVVLDKGTFDAISLMPHDGDARHPCEVYHEKVVPLIKPLHFLCITSCNWTKSEVLDWLAPPGSELSYFSEAKYPSFTFGGHTGQSIVTLVLQKSQT